jgi:hypothetical protein
MPMNAKRRLEEFIFKLHITRNNNSHVDSINEIKLKVNLDNQKIIDDKNKNRLTNKFI